MAAFAANSLFCRLALAGEHIDAASFTAIRLLSGTVMLWGILQYRAIIDCLLRRNKDLTLSLKSKSDSHNKPQFNHTRWLSAFALFTYAAAFSFAYIELPTAIGALILFGVVQVVMVTHGIMQGELLGLKQKVGFFTAIIGLVMLFLPQLLTTDINDIDTLSALLMLIAGIAWALYSIQAKGVTEPIRVSANNFLYALPFTLVLSILLYSQMKFNQVGLVYAILSGALASGAGYALWYAVVPHLKSTYAASVQLTVPVLAAIAAIIWLDEDLTWLISLSSFLLLSGVALVIHSRPPS
ncbi:DMT family transporter [Algibacillus agarilyticus]|uniref:DMT family transporter n=1 Tax=Algibacillus agarilyticus TaxID=2234133 RepID=UPI000DCFB98F|nr:DMT family transporter [Algibacillus agarilyticus]